ncbi:sterol desaturase family protein [Acaryochloris thomasi]|nr:sterol desaturase family protein [Acaryochloris thomasi]
MNNFWIQPNFWLYWFVFCGIIMGGYFLTASGAYYLLHSTIGKVPTLPLKSKAAQQESETMVGDIKLSVLSVIFFALGAACFMACYDWGITQVYTHWKIQDMGYLACSYIVVLLLQDTYFYFTHRLFHLPLLFKWFHQGHHVSRPPTPWTFFALEPMEAFTQASFLLGITLIIPLHVGVLIAILLTMTIWATGNHLGLQIIPRSRQSRWWGQWCIGASHHLVHHSRFTRHYGLYFTFWDRIMGTQDATYKARFLQ